MNVTSFFPFRLTPSEYGSSSENEEFSDFKTTQAHVESPLNLKGKPKGDATPRRKTSAAKKEDKSTATKETTDNASTLAKYKDALAKAEAKAIEEATKAAAIKATEDAIKAEAKRIEEETKASALKSAEDSIKAEVKRIEEETKAAVIKTAEDAIKAEAIKADGDGTTAAALKIIEGNATVQGLILTVTEMQALLVNLPSDSRAKASIQQHIALLEHNARCLQLQQGRATLLSKLQQARKYNQDLTKTSVQ